MGLPAREARQSGSRRADLFYSQESANQPVALAASPFRQTIQKQRRFLAWWAIFHLFDIGPLRILMISTASRRCDPPFRRVAGARSGEEPRPWICRAPAISFKTGNGGAACLSRESRLDWGLTRLPIEPHSRKEPL